MDKNYKIISFMKTLSVLGREIINCQFNAGFLPSLIIGQEVTCIMPGFDHIRDPPEKD